MRVVSLEIAVIVIVCVSLSFPDPILDSPTDCAAPSSSMIISFTDAITGISFTAVTATLNEVISVSTPPLSIPPESATLMVMVDSP